MTPTKIYLVYEVDEYGGLELLATHLTEEEAEAAYYARVLEAVREDGPERADLPDDTDRDKLDELYEIILDSRQEPGGLNWREIDLPTPAAPPPPPTITLHLDEWDELICPKCGGTALAATIEEFHQGCALSYAGGDGAYLGLFDVNTWDGDHAASDVTRITCKTCDFAIDGPQADRIVVIEAGGRESGDG